MKSKTLEKRFWDKVQKSDGCWGWTGATCVGYGQIYDGERNQLAHRISWILNRGPIPEGLLVLHKCDNPPCTNPDHLFLGTHRDNTQDMFRKNRENNVRGEGHPMTYFSEEQVVELRRRYRNGEKIRDLADEFGVKRDSLYPVISGRNWKHIPGAVKLGLPKGTANHAAKLTEQKVIDAYYRIVSGETISDVARELGCTKTALGYAVNGKTWKHLKLPPIKLKTAKGTRNHCTNLTPDDIREIRAMRSRGETYTTIAEKFSLSPASVYNIISGKTWSHVT